MSSNHYNMLEFGPSLAWTVKIRNYNQFNKISFQCFLYCCKLQIVFKSRSRLSNNFHFKDQYGLCNESCYEECFMRHLNVRIGDHIRILPLTKNNVTPKGKAACYHLLICDHLPSFDSFSVLSTKSRKFLLELKAKPIQIERKTSLNRNIRSEPLYLFDRV